jgi:hypothetical protein
LLALFVFAELASGLAALDAGDRVGEHLSLAFHWRLAQDLVV